MKRDRSYRRRQRVRTIHRKEGIVEQLWCNDFSPSDAVPDTDAYLEAKRKHEKAYDELAGKLSLDQLTEVEELIGHVMDQYDGIIVEAFRQGLKFGIELMTNLSQ